MNKREMISKNIKHQKKKKGDSSNVREEVKETTNFKEDLNADSLDLFELVMALEEEYNIEIPSEDLAELNTVEDVMKYLQAKGV